MSDQWILLDNEEQCPECKELVLRWNELIRNEPFSWLTVAMIDYATDFDGEMPGVGGIIEAGRNELPAIFS